MRVATTIAVVLLLPGSGVVACSWSGDDETPTNTPDSVPDPVPSLTITPASPTPSTPSAASTEAGRAEPVPFLTDAFGTEASETVSTMALFDDASIAERVPEPRLRAAFVLMNVTIAAPLIDTYMNSDIYVGKVDWIEASGHVSSRPGRGRTASS